MAVYTPEGPRFSQPEYPHEIEDSPARPFFWEVVALSKVLHVANIVVLPSFGANSPSRGYHEPETSAQFRDLARCLHVRGMDLVGPDSASSVLLFTVFLPSMDYSVNRTDYFQLRLQDCSHPIKHIYETLEPFQRYMPISPRFDLLGLIYKAAAVVQWADLPSWVNIMQLKDAMSCQTLELKARLNAPFVSSLSTKPVERKRVALIRGRPNITAGGPVYRAAAALGLDLVIVDEKGHWLQEDTPENRKHREAFLVTDMTEDAGVAHRIINSLGRYGRPIHGVFTLSDNFFVVVAKVAEVLNLPTSPVSAFETSVDKYRSRLTQDAPGNTARVANLKELYGLLSRPTLNDKRPVFTPAYPMIVKPTKGWSSECVSKVTNDRDLALAVLKATRRHGSAAVIEPFFDGPEIDVNFILLDGEILFSEIADEDPCDADETTASVNDTFSPKALSMPSSLPVEEQEIAKSTLRDILVKLGFRTGVFHVEARMVNSAYEYRRSDSGIIDLAPKISPPAKPPVCRLIEINARPAGYRVSVPVKHTYGVDYFAAHMLAAVGDHDRLKMVSQPFDRPFQSRLVYIPAPAAGTVRWKDDNMSPSDELKRRCPELAQHIVLAVDYHRPGDKVELFTDGAQTYVAHILLGRAESRSSLIRLAEQVHENYRIDIERSLVSLGDHQHTHLFTKS